MVGTVVKEKIGELEEELREGCLSRMSKELADVVQLILGKKRFLERFKDGCEKNLSSNQLTIVIVEKILEEKEPEVFMNIEIPEDQVNLDQGYYHCAYVILRFKNEVDVEIKEEQSYMEDVPGEEDIEDFKLENDNERHLRMGFKDSYGGMGDKKALIHTKRWYVYVNKEGNLIKGGYSLEFVGSEGKKVFWNLVENHFVEE